MKRRSIVLTKTPPDPFELVRMVGLSLPDVEAATRYDGSPVLKMRGCFMAGLAAHSSAEPATLVVRAGLEERETFLEEAPEIFYLTEYYRRHPVVLARLARLGRDALRDLLKMSWRLTSLKAPARARSAARAIRNRD